jgi:hypothetical protein
LTQKQMRERAEQAEAERDLLRNTVDEANCLVVDLRTALWEALPGIRGEDRTLVWMVRLLAQKLDEAQDNRRGEFDLRKQAEAERDEAAVAYVEEVHRLTDREIALRAERDALKAELATAVRLAREATNGWAAHAIHNREHDEISRLHLAISALSVPALPAEVQ